MESTENRKYFIEEVKYYNNAGSLTKTCFFLIYNDTIDVGIFRRKLKPCKKYVTHTLYDFKGDPVPKRTDFKSEKIAKAAVRDFLSKGIELPTQISKIIEV